MAAVASVAAAASAEVMDRPQGIKIGQRMTLRPYVNLSVGYDSNPDQRHNDAQGDVLWTVNPALGLTYKAENWALDFNVYYRYHAYCKKQTLNRQNQHNYGESLRYQWSNSRGGEKGWSLMLTETFQKVTMADDWTLNDGRSYNNDRWELTVQGAVQRRFNEFWHADVNASYYNLDYDNDGGYGSLYSWQRWTAGLEAGFAPSRWTDLIIAGGYQGYRQDNTVGYSGESQGYTVQGGIGSYATDRISYRLLAGWSRFEYARSASTDNGFVYTGSLNWKFDTWHTMLLLSSYYQPSEREYNTRSRVDSVSWGLGKSLIRGKLTATFDTAYRHETHDHISNAGTDYALDILSARLGFNYTLNRYIGFFLYGEYLRSWNDDGERVNGYGDYDRWRVTGGLRLTY